MAQIVTRRLIMRPYRAGEHGLMRAVIADPRVTFWHRHPMSEAESRAILEAKLALAPRGLGAFAVFLGDRVGPDGAPVFVGQVLLQPLAGSGEIEIGWHFAPEHWGNGYASEAAAALLAHAFDGLGLARVVAVVLPDNQRSLGVIHSLAMTEARMRIHAGRRHRYFVAERHEHQAGSSPLRAALE